MTKQELAEECGYELQKGIVIRSDEAITCSDTFYPVDEAKEYWYNNETEMFFENTTKGLNQLCKFEVKKAEERDAKLREAKHNGTKTKIRR